MALLPKYDFSRESAIKDSLFLSLNATLLEANKEDSRSDLHLSEENQREKLSYKEMSSLILPSALKTGSNHSAKDASKKNSVKKAESFGGIGKK